VWKIKLSRYDRKYLIKKKTIKWRQGPFRNATTVYKASVMQNEEKPRLGDEAPGWREMVIVIIATGLLIALGWITWFKFGWFH